MDIMQEFYIKNSLLCDVTENSPTHFQGKRKEEVVLEIAEYFLEFYLDDYKMRFHFTPDQVTAAAVALGRRMCNISPEWSTLLAKRSLHNYQDILPCVDYILKLLFHKEMQNRK